MGKLPSAGIKKSPVSRNTPSQIYKLQKGILSSRQLARSQHMSQDYNCVQSLSAKIIFDTAQLTVEVMLIQATMTYQSLQIFYELV